MNEAIERMNKKVIISLNEYLELENIKKYHEENMKVSYGKVIIPPEDLERYKALEHNWNELKKWLEERCKDNMELITFRLAICRVLDKLKELEEGGNNENI